MKTIKLLEINKMYEGKLQKQKKETKPKLSRCSAARGDHPATTDLQKEVEVPRWRELSVSRETLCVNGGGFIRQY
jgi:hypothetical protein